MESSSGRVAEVYKDSNSQWRWRVRAGNHEIVAEGESYRDQRDARRGLEDAHVEHDRVEVIEDFLNG